MIIKKNRQNLRERKVVKEQIQESAANSIVVPNETNTQQVEQQIEKQEPEIDLFDIENIDFTQRQERRRGTRRRGYRRIDDRNLVSRAQDEAETIKKSAFEEGYRNGLNQAEEDLAKFRDSIKNFMKAKEEVFEYIAPDILEMSVSIAKTIIKKEVESDPQVLINTIVDVLKTVSKNEPKINIRVQPQAAAFVKDSLSEISYQYGIDSKINIISDPSIEEGGCVFQTNNGIVDASIDTQLEIIKKALEGM
jgi:flagellar assembly protein FliH